MKSTSDLKKGDIINLSKNGAMTPPVTSTTEKMFREHGPGLQFITRSNGDLMRAYESMKNYSILYGDDYTLDLMEDIMRLGAAHNGQRVQDSIEALRAAGPLPGEAYTNTAKGNGEATAIREDVTDDC